MKLTISRKFLIPGTTLIIIAFAALLYQRQIKSKELIVIIEGLQTVSEEEVRGVINLMIEQASPPAANSLNLNELTEMLTLHPRIDKVQATLARSRLTIQIRENETGYLVHRPPNLMEYSKSHEILQERISEKKEIPREIPIFYLTAEKDNEISLIRRDIMHIWSQTREYYSGIWEKISEISIGRTSAGQIEILFFHAEQPVSIAVYDNFGTKELAKLWAILAFIENPTGEDPTGEDQLGQDPTGDGLATRDKEPGRKKANASRTEMKIKIFGDHAIVQ